SGSWVTSCPPRKTVPGGGSHSRASKRPRVDLPLPVAPTTATVSPAATSKLTSRSAGGRFGYANVRCENWIVAGVVVAGFFVAGSVRPAWIEGGLIGERAGSDTPG